MARSATRSGSRGMMATLALALLVTQASAMRVRGAEVDTVAPTAPVDFHLVSRTKSSSITLGWVASYDAVGVAGYSLYRNGSWSGTLYQAGVDLIGTVWYDRITGRSKAPITYDLYAFDAAGNVSAPATLVVAP